MTRPAPTAADLALLDPEGAFRARLVADRERLEELAGAASGAMQRAELQVIVHRLAGAAGTFGFAEIGDRAIALDDALLDRSAEIAPLLAGLLVALAAI